MTKIKLNEKEKNIFKFLLKIHSKANLKGDLRVAGGWVRDKLLGLESDDIDISLDGITGKQFENIIEESYSKEFNSANIGKSFTVNRCPEMSKHLETVGIKIYNQKIDFVNLRSDKYGDTRIPEIKMGTPYEDAHRRDLTINAIFYNINKQEIEDFTGKGLSDLNLGVLRTPLDPEQTFLDDPLRMLRILRFVSKFKYFSLDSDGDFGCSSILKAMSNRNIKKAYRDKVSPMRAGPELIKMLKDDRPAYAIRLMFLTGLDRVVFVPPETGEGICLDLDQKSSYHKLNLREHTLSTVSNIDTLSRKEHISDDTRFKLIFVALFHDYGKAYPGIAQPHKDFPDKMTYVGHELKSSDIADSVLKSIGIGDKDRLFITRLIQLHMAPHSLEKEILSQRNIGKILRQLNIDGYTEGNIDDIHLQRLRKEELTNMWKYLFLHSIADIMSKGMDYKDDLKLKNMHIKQFQEYVDRPPPTKPLLNGHVIMSLFPNLVPGKWISEITEYLIEAQDERKVTTEEEAKVLIESIRHKYC